MAGSNPNDDDRRTHETPGGPLRGGDPDARTRRTPGGTPEDDDAIARTAPTRATPDVGRAIGGKYVIVRRLAEGGFGIVFEGYYTIQGNRIRVAIKMLSPSRHQDRAAAVRFDEEVRTLCQLLHPNICRVIDGGIDEATSRPFLVMDYADGGSLKGKLREAGGRIDPATALRWLEEAARGLLAAEQNVAKDGTPAPVHHRDVKPENLLLQQGRVVVADFGAAKLGGRTQAVTSELVPPLWTPEYGSPEQGLEGFADHRSDIYALGATFFHLLTGQLTNVRVEGKDKTSSKPPPDDAPRVPTRFRRAHDPCAIRPEVPRELGAIVRRMTEPEADDRYQSFAEVLADIEKLKAAPVARWPKILLAAVGLAALTVGGLEYAGVTSLFAQRGERAETVRELRETSAALTERVAVLQQQDLELFGNLAARLAAIDADLERSRAWLAKLPASIEPDQSPARPAGLVPLRDVARRAEQLAEDVTAHVEVRDAMRRLAVAVEGIATADAEGRLAELETKIDGLRDPSGLRRERSRIAQRVAELQRGRETPVDALEQRLAAGDFDAIEAASAELVTSCETLGETGLAERVRRATALATTGRALRERLPEWSAWRTGADDAEARLAALARASRELGDLRGELDDERLRAWFDAEAAARRMRWAGAAGEAVGAEVEAVNEAIRVFGEADATDEAERARLEALRPRVVRLQEALLDLARSTEWSDPRIAAALLRQVAAIPAPPPEPGPGVRPDLPPLPEGWPDERFAAPPGIRSLALAAEDPTSARLYPAQFLERAQREGLRLWYFDARRDREGARVYMAFCASESGDRAALIDIHPVTLAEIGVDTYRTVTVQYLAGSFVRDRGRESLQTMAVDTSQAIAESFAGAVSAAIGARLQLPPEGHRDWPAARPFGEIEVPAPRAGVYPRVALPTDDVSTGGLCYLRAGVREWTEGGPVGVSLVPGEQKDTPRRRDSGFRLAVVLSRRGE